jgi:hypothetical protein
MATYFYILFFTSSISFNFMTVIVFNVWNLPGHEVISSRILVTEGSIVLGQFWRRSFPQQAK